MVDHKVGFGFRPTDDELVGYYLPHKIHGNNHLVEDSINEVNICSYDPWDLRLQSKYKSRDPFWYFFSRRENKYASGNQQSRRTSSGFWKITGDPVDVKDQWGKWRGGVPGKLGHKRVLVFLKGKSSKGIKSDWVMHEYYNTLLPDHQRNYVICRLEYKGEDKNMLTDNPTNITHSTGSVVDQSLHGNSESVNTFFDYDSANQDFNMPLQQSVQAEYYDTPNLDHWFSFSNNFNPQQDEDPYSDMLWDYEISQNYESLVDERRTFMQENYNDHRPRNPVSGVLSDDDDDDDTDSMIGRNTSSSTTSVASSNGSYHTSSTVEPLQDNEAQEEPKNLKLQLHNKEKVMNTQRSECEWKMEEDWIKKTRCAKTMVRKQSCWIVLEERSEKNSKWDYLKNMVIGFLLFISIIGWIILVG